jgi:hypothetical protein
MNVPVEAFIRRFPVQPMEKTPGPKPDKSIPSVSKRREG